MSFECFSGVPGCLTPLPSFCLLLMLTHWLPSLSCPRHPSCPYSLLVQIPIIPRTSTPPLLFSQRRGGRPLHRLQCARLQRRRRAPSRTGRHEVVQSRRHQFAQSEGLHQGGQQGRREHVLCRPVLVHHPHRKEGLTVRSMPDVSARRSVACMRVFRVVGEGRIAVNPGRLRRWEIHLVYTGFTSCAWMRGSMLAWAQVHWAECDRPSPFRRPSVVGSTNVGNDSKRHF